MKKNLLNCDRAGLAEHLESRGEKSFRARQLIRWIYKRGASDFSQMSDLSEKLRATLADEFEFAPPLKLIADSRAFDGTRKFLFDVGDGQAVESVLIPSARRMTLCISTQAGCALACQFCHTGMQGFVRNLSAAEIIGQLQFANSSLGGGRVTNVVMMGMGEPLLNLENAAVALRLMTDADGLGLSRRRVTVSTAGIVPAIDRLRDECPVALAVSLHASRDDLRSELMPINRKYPLSELMSACRRYLGLDGESRAAPRDFITFEYVMLKGVNDSINDADDLAELIKDIPCKINLIPFNPFIGADFSASSPSAIRSFRDCLSAKGIVTTIRKTRGDDIAAACGQLAGQVKGGRPSAFSKSIKLAVPTQAAA